MFLKFRIVAIYKSLDKIKETVAQGVNDSASIGIDLPCHLTSDENAFFFLSIVCKQKSRTMTRKAVSIIGRFLSIHGVTLFIMTDRRVRITKEHCTSEQSHTFTK